MGAIREPDFKAPALGHGFMFDEADGLGHGRMIAPIRADGQAEAWGSGKPAY